MITKIKIDERIIGYLKKLPSYRFPTSFDLIFSLFLTYEKGNKYVEDIAVLLDCLGYKNLKEIPPETLDNVKELIKMNWDYWENLSDPERCTYLLLHEIKQKNILMMIDTNIVEDLSKEINITSKSIISFIDLQYINSIKNELK